MLGSVVTNTGKAEAVIYSFTNYNPGGGDVTANGFFDLSTAPGATIDWGNDVNAFSITLSAIGESDVTLNQLSQILQSDLNTASVSVDGTFFNWGIVNNGSSALQIVDGSTNSFIVGQSASSGFESLVIAPTNISNISSSVGEAFGGGFIATAATPVPFELSPTMGLLAVGGIWSISRLCKRIADRKLQ